MDRRAFVLASASLLAAPRAFALGSTEVALVTADLESPRRGRARDRTRPAPRRDAPEAAGDEPPQHVTFRGDRAYVASGESGTLRMHRVNGPALRLTSVPEDSYNVQQSHGWVVTPGLGRGTLCILDARGRMLRTVTVARSSHDACIVTTRG